MRIARKAQAGTMQSSDLVVQVEPAEGLVVEVRSTVKKQFEQLIRARVEAVLQAEGVVAGRVLIDDRGALDYAIQARLETALARARAEAG